MDRILIKNCDIPNFDTGEIVTKDIKIAQGRIVDVGILLQWEDCKIIDAKNKLCLPAFVDTHTHMVQSLQKGLLDDLNITSWLLGMLSTQKRLTEEQWYYGVYLGLLQGIRFGTTTFNEMTYFPQIDAVAQAYKDAGVRVVFGLGATDISENEFIPAEGIDTAMYQAEYIYGKYHGASAGLISTSVAPQGMPANSKELVQSLKKFANERGLIFHTHLAEGKKETQKVKKRTGYYEAEALYNYGVLDEKTVLAHSIWLQDFEIELLKETNANVAHCPSTNMKLSDGTPRIAQMLNSGVNVTIGCDGEGSSSNRDLIREVRLGSYLQKVHTLNPEEISTKQAYEMITINGAKALGFSNLGKIEKGYKADVTLVDLDDIALLGSKNRLSNFLYAGTGYQVDTVLCEGKIVLENKEFTDVNAATVMEKANKIIEHLIDVKG